MASRKTKAKATSKVSTPVKRTRRLLPVLTGLDTDVLARATLNGARVDTALVDAIVGIERDLVFDERANVLSLACHDDATEILRSDLLAGPVDLDLGPGGRWRYDYTRDIGAISVDGTTTTLQLWCVSSALLRGQTAPLRKSTAKMSLAGWSRYLAREIAGEVDLRVICPNPGEIPPPETTTDSAVSTTRSRGTGRGFSGAQAAKVTVKHVRADAAQLRAIDAILAEADRLGASRMVMVATIMCATQESVIRNLRSGDNRRSDTIGYFQQGPEWISPQSTNDPAKGCRAFLLGHEANVGGREKAKRGWKQHFGSLRNAPSDLAAAIFRVQVGGAGAGAWRTEAIRTVDLWLNGNGTAASSAATAGAVTLPAEWRRGAAGKRESSWTALQRECQRLGRRRFIALPWSPQPRLVVAADQQLILARPHLTIQGFSDAILVDRPSVQLEGIKRAQQVDLTVVKDAWTAPPGAVVEWVDAGRIDGPWLVASLNDTSGSPTARVTLQQPTTHAQPDPATSSAAKGTTAEVSIAIPGGGRAEITTRGGARGIVEQAARLSAAVGGSGVFVVSAFRPGSKTSSGNLSDHAGNDAGRAARDIAVRGIDAIVGPPSPKLDQAVVALGKAFGRRYRAGQRIVDTFPWRGFQVQIIWRTPEYGGHMGHIHCGAHRKP